MDQEKPIPTELLPEARTFLHELETDVVPIEVKSGQQTIDDEYADTGCKSLSNITLKNRHLIESNQKRE